MKIGQYNTLIVNRLVDFGAYLIDTDGAEVLMPSRYITAPLKPGDELEVFVYRDSDDRPVAVTDRPHATVGEFAYLKCVAATRIGAFLDWGLPKDILVPYSEQRAKMRPDGVYLVYLYLDHASGRVVASAKVEKFLGNVRPSYRSGTSVNALITGRSDIGYSCIVDNLHRGMLYHNELHVPLEVGQVIKASVKSIRSDGKLDLSAGGSAVERTAQLAERIEATLRLEGHLPVNDRSTPDDIDAAFQCSKKDFKKAIGHLLRLRKIGINENGSIVLAQK
ncbi:MAG: S1-like domain-containing RNA-binding protein [Muribaculaceae bacterium]|nr:S1-like domain-containing RNA-binding protein [Muribaculaceae bacterium]